MRPTSLLLLASAALSACTKRPAAVEAPASADVARPALAVLVVVDQLSPRLLDTPRERYTRGLATLTGPDAASVVARFPYAITYTCPGHATISTGAAPSVSGIVSNDWWVADGSEAGGRGVYCADPAFLRVGTLADRVREGGGAVAAVSLKDRAAMMLGGSQAEVVSWFDTDAFDFTGPLAGAVDARAHLGPWEALHPEDYATWVGPDDGPLENDPGFGTVFPHPAPSPKRFLVTPGAGEALVDAALAATDRLGLGTTRQAPDLLAVSFSNIDYIGHTFTTESWEAMDAMVRLDRSLGRLLDGLEERVGEGRVAVFLSSDHGSSVAAGKHRIPQGAVEAAADAALAAQGITGTVVFESPSIWLPAAARDEPQRYEAAALAVAEAVAAVDGIEDAFAWRVRPPTGPHADAVLLSLDDERSGDVYVLRGEDALYDYPRSEGRGTSHGTPFPHDTDVPLLAWGPGVKPQGRGQVVDVRQIAPTLAALLGISSPDGATEAPATYLLGR